MLNFRNNISTRKNTFVPQKKSVNPYSPPTQLRPTSEFCSDQNKFVPLPTLRSINTGTLIGHFKIFIIMSKGNMLLGHARGKVGSLCLLARQTLFVQR